MKNKILEIYKDYKVEFLKYYNILKIKTNKIYEKIKIYYLKLKEELVKKENRKKYLTTTGIVLFLNLLLVSLYISYGYYHNEASLTLIKAVVGDLYIKDYDLVVLVYLEDSDSNGNGNGKYYVADNVPELGYDYSGYKCENDSILIYDKETKITSVTTTHREICHIYFDLTKTSDLSIKIMIEDELNSEMYSMSEQIPAFGYKYSHYECTNNGTLEYNSELHSVKLSSNTKESCNIYFKKEKSDITLNLYVEDNYLSGEYIKRNSIPSNKLYMLNESKSNCENNNERIDTTITYINGYINIDNVDQISNCSIYLDLNEE